jgi:hypothetical protein
VGVDEVWVWGWKWGLGCGVGKSGLCQCPHLGRELDLDELLDRPRRLAARKVVRVQEKRDIQLITEHATAGYFASRTQSTQGYRFATWPNNSTRKHHAWRAC